MPLRNGPHGYGTVTKSLHWLTVAGHVGLVLEHTVVRRHAHLSRMV